MGREGVYAPAVAVLMALAVFAAVVFLGAPRTTHVKAGQAAPDLNLPEVGRSSRRIRVAELRGLPLLLVFFDTASPSGKPQISQIEALFRQYQPRGFRVVGVAVDADPLAADRFLSALGTSFPVVSDPGGAAVKAAYGTTDFPEAYLIEITGRVRAVYPGPVGWGSDAVQHAVDSTLHRNAPRPVAP
jgi:peroxiredoxin